MSVKKISKISSNKAYVSKTLPVKNIHVNVTAPKGGKAGKIKFPKQKLG